MSGPRIAVFGAGANGGAIAHALHLAGADVTAVDPWPAHVEAIRASGLILNTPEGSSLAHVPALHLCQLAEPAPAYDLIVLGVKAYDTGWACELLRDQLAADGTIVAVQNGITLDAVARVFGEDRSVGAVIEVAANMFEPGVIEQEAPIWLALGGETPEAQRRAAAAAAILSPAGSTTVVEDIRSAKWMKLVANACELVPSAILDLPLAQAIALPGMHDLMLRTGQEALDVGLASGRSIVPIFEALSTAHTPAAEDYVSRLLDVVLHDYTFPDTLTTVLQDWRKGRRAEIDELNGLVVEVAGSREAAPLNSRVHRIARAIEDGKTTAGLHNLGALLE